MTRIPPAIYQLKVTLLGTRPAIWRRLLVPGGLTLEQLHHVLQAAMGWTESHLHDFQIGEERFAEPDPEDDAEDERKARLAEVLGWAGAKAVYTYDYGDGWEHSIAVEKILPPEPGVDHPVCVAGKRRCPPEDCGGVGGYYDLLKVLANPKHPEHGEMLEWVGGAFDPEAFSVDEANQRLAFLLPRKPKTTRRKSPS